MPFYFQVLQHSSQRTDRTPGEEEAKKCKYVKAEVL